MLNSLQFCLGSSCFKFQYWTNIAALLHCNHKNHNFMPIHLAKTQKLTITPTVCAAGIKIKEKTWVGDRDGKDVWLYATGYMLAMFVNSLKINKNIILSAQTTKQDCRMFFFRWRSFVGTHMFLFVCVLPALPHTSWGLLCSFYNHWLNSAGTPVFCDSYWNKSDGYSKWVRQWIKKKWMY